MHVHVHSIGESGSYEKILNEKLENNNLPEIKIPATPQSRRILEMASREENKAKETFTEQENVEMTTNNPMTAQPESTQEFKLKGKEIGLFIIKPESQGWPDNNLSLRKLKEGLENRKYKSTYLDNQYDETDICKLIIINKIDLENCWRTTDDDSFRKLRPGLHQERTPPPPKLTRKQRHNSK